MGIGLSGNRPHRPCNGKEREEKIMKLGSVSHVTVIAKGEPTRSIDGKTEYFKITVLQGAEAGQLSCPQDVYLGLSVGKEADLMLEYNDQYKSLKVVGIAYGYEKESPHFATTAPSGLDKPQDADGKAASAQKSK